MQESLDDILNKYKQIEDKVETDAVKPKEVKPKEVKPKEVKPNVIRPVIVKEVVVDKHAEAGFSTPKVVEKKHKEPKQPS